MRVLDFGCGDMIFSEELQRANPSLRITGVDVVDFGNRPKGIRFLLYDGKKLPFRKETFDVVIAYHVFHHTTRPFDLFRECVRVSKKMILFVEPTFRGWWDIPGMRLLDWVFNVWKDRSVSLPYAFSSERQWKEEITKAGFVLTSISDVELLPRWFPTGRSLLFVCTRPTDRGSKAAGK